MPHLTHRIISSLYLFKLGRLVVLCLATSFLLMLPPRAFAQDLDESTYALQNRLYHLHHEFSVGAGWFPLDAFEKGYSLNLGYTYHFNDAWGLELPQLLVVKNISTDLQDQLIRLGVQSTPRDSMQYLATVSVVFKPAYRKVILFNHKVIHGETYFVLGGGTFKFESGLKPTASFGAGIRVFLNQRFSTRLEVRDHVWFDQLNPTNELTFSLGLGFNLGG